MWMNALKAMIGVTTMQHAIILKEVTLAFATLDTQAAGFLVLVSLFTN